MERKKKRNICHGFFNFHVLDVAQVAMIRCKMEPKMIKSLLARWGKNDVHS
jgi:hypothetical protein